MRNQPSVSDPIAEELRLIRQNVPGVRGSVTATSDGLLVAHDMHGLEPTQVAALVAATHAVAVRASLSTECGQLKEVITRGADGYLAVYAAGGPVIVAVLGTSELNVAMLNFQARKMIERDNVDLLMGNVNSALAQAMAQVSNEKGVLHIAAEVVEQ